MTLFDQGVPTAPAAWLLTVRGNDLIEYDGAVDGYDSVHASLLQNGQPGTWDLTLPLAHEATDLLLTEGFGIVARLPGTGEVMWSGNVDQTKTLYQQGADGHSQVTFAGADDNSILAGELAWPEPGKWLNDGSSRNTVSGGVDSRTGAAETVLLGFVKDNIGSTAFHSTSTTPHIDRRLSYLTVPASSGRGTSGTYQAGWPTLLLDLVTTICRAGGITVRLAQDTPGQIAVTVRARADVSADVVFSQAEGSLQSAEFDRTSPTVTQGIAVSDDGTTRSFAMVIDTAAEALWGRRWVATTDGGSAVIADLLAAAGDLVAAGIEQAGAVIAPVQLPQGVQFGRDYQLGDLVTVVTADGTSIVDQLAQVTYAHEAGSPPTITPSVGISQDDQDSALVPLLRQINAAIRQLQRGPR